MKSTRQSYSSGEIAASVAAAKERNWDYLVLMHRNVQHSDLYALLNEPGVERLRRLDLEDCSLTTLPREFQKLTALEVLDVRNNQLTDFPSELCHFYSLTILHLGNNKLSSVPPELGELSSLKELWLSSNLLSSLPSELAKISALESLFLHDNQLSTLPSELTKLSYLESLTLHNNQLSALPLEIGQLAVLTTLSVYNNKLTVLPESLGALTQLRTLRLWNNNVTVLPESLRNLTQLQELALGGNPLSALPEWLGGFTDLKILDLRENQLTALPEWLRDLSQLRELYLPDNQLASLPDWLGNLTELKRLWLQKNQLTSLPEVLGNLIGLQQLNLGYNKLKKWPQFIFNLTNLQELNVHSNTLKALPSGIGKLKALKKLVAARTGISTLPKEIGELNNLEYLDICHNKLNSLPTEIGELSNLTYFDIGATKLSPLPEAIWRLSKLRELRTGGNNLRKLPTELFQLTELTDLWLSHNSLSKLPQEIINLTKLKVLYLHGNPLLKIPSEILGNTWEDVYNNNAKPPAAQPIIDFYFRSHYPSIVLPLPVQQPPGDKPPPPVGGKGSPDFSEQPDDGDGEKKPEGNQGGQGHPLFGDSTPTKTDRLGRENLIEVLATIIEDDSQPTPQTFALFAPWGAGKSSVMELLRRRLDKVYRRKKEKEEGKQQGMNEECDTKGSVHTAWLNAWEYEHTGNLAAALAQEVMRGLRPEFRWKSREFWSTVIQYQWKRNRLSLLVLSSVMILAVVWAIVLCCKKTSINALVWPVSFLPLLYYTLPKATEILTHPLAVKLSTYLKVPRYDKYLGCLPVIHEDLRTLCSIRLGYTRDQSNDKCNRCSQDLSSETPRRLVVFIDDLDRCGSKCIVDMLDALRLVLDLENVFVIIGIDHRIALTAVAKQYAQVEGDGRTHGEIARDYLGKIIQIPITLQPSSQEELENYLKGKLFSPDGNNVDLGEVRREAVSFSKIYPISAQDSSSKTRSTPSIPRGKSKSTSFSEDFPSQEQKGEMSEIKDIDRPIQPAAVTEVANPREKLMQVMKHDDAEIKWFCFLQYVFKFDNPRQIMRLKDSYSLLKALLFQGNRWITNGGIDRTKRYELLRMLFYLEYLNTIPSSCRKTVERLVEEGQTKEVCKCDLEKTKAEMKELCGKIPLITDIMRLYLNEENPWKNLRPADNIDRGFYEMKDCVTYVVLPALQAEIEKASKNAVKASSA